MSALANIPSACKTANTAQNDAMILSYDANLSRMEFSERKGIDAGTIIAAKSVVSLETSIVHDH
jgi:hypothetical protein